LKPKWIAVAVSLSFLVLGQASLSAQDKPAPDNTKVNKTAKPTADKATNNAGDRDLMQKIRKAVVDDKSLSTYAHNVKIVAQNGKVTLKGPVRSTEEKATIERIATDVAGAGNVVNQITIAKSTKKTN
jgi:osmotically-inducible protein OsmY